jgi:2-polyprenyl-3-methyl-5-hydroxy-6-metoxy-1,4-benzoquinol methylase
MKLSHVVTNNRKLKAKKLLNILSNHINLDKKAKILSIGIGSGFIERHLQLLGYNLTGVDIVDNRRVKSFPFKLINDEKLPFKKNSFNVVISNHVIEHVLNQKKHLSEIKRVLKPNGCAYVATPNKYSYS